MEKTRIFLIRHAETIGNIQKRLTGRKDYELTKKGYQSTELLAEKLKDIHFDKAFSSPSKRTSKTILKVAQNNHIPITEVEDLSEMYFGIYDGWKWEDVNKINPEIKETQNKINEIEGIQNQESMQEVAERMYHCIMQIAKENKGCNLLIASHGVAIEAFLRKITGVPFSQEREEYCQHNTSINELIFDGEKFQIIKMCEKID